MASDLNIVQCSSKYSVKQLKSASKFLLTHSHELKTEIISFYSPGHQLMGLWHDVGQNSIAPKLKVELSAGDTRVEGQLINPSTPQTLFYGTPTFVLFRAILDAREINLPN